jgi:hypothetical protein
MTDFYFVGLALINAALAKYRPTQPTQAMFVFRCRDLARLATLPLVIAQKSNDVIQILIRKQQVTRSSRVVGSRFLRKTGDSSTSSSAVRRRGHTPRHHLLHLARRRIVRLRFLGAVVRPL